MYWRVAGVTPKITALSLVVTITKGASSLSSLIKVTDGPENQIFPLILNKLPSDSYDESIGS